MKRIITNMSLSLNLHELQAHEGGQGGAIVGSWAVMDGDLRFWAEEFGQRIRVDLWNMQLETILKETNRICALSGPAAVALWTLRC